MVQEVLFLSQGILGKADTDFPVRNAPVKGSGRKNDAY
jgi:hypothetical protein